MGGSIISRDLSLILYPSCMLAQVQRKGLLFRQQKTFEGENTSLDGKKRVSSVESYFKTWKSGRKEFFLGWKCTLERVYSGHTRQGITAVYSLLGWLCTKVLF